MKFSINSSFGFGNMQALETAKQISDIHPLDGKLVFDLQGFTENNPFNNLLVACSINNYRKMHPEVECSLIPKAHDDYLSHLGFYDMINIDFGKKLGQAKASSNYVPINKFEFSPTFYYDIEDKAKELANVLRFDSSFSRFLSYIFVETIRNVYEHANINTVYFSAQKWRKFDLVEISIVDTGCGIANALSEKYSGRSEEELINLATKPGITAGSNHRYLDRDDTWRNSGYGLYILKELAVEYDGCFVLCSKNYALHYSKSGVKKYSTYFDGTAVSIRIKTNTENDFSKLLSRIVKRGEEESSSFDGVIKRASKSSGGKY